MKMFRGLNSKTIAIVAALAIGLLAITATGSILAPMGALAHSPFSGQSSDQQSQGPQGPQEWNQGTRDQYLQSMQEMLRDHMGLEGSEAEAWSETMLKRMEQYGGSGGSDEGSAADSWNCDMDEYGMGGYDMDEYGMGGSGMGGSGMMGGYNQSP